MKASSMEIDEFYMSLAIKQAEKSMKKGEVPIGAVIVYSGEDKTRTRKTNYIKCLSKIERRYKKGDIISKAYNKRNKSKKTTHHAEILAIEKANKKLKDYRLEGCTMYVTLEPCPMCCGAILASRLDRLVIGTKSDKMGSVGSVVNILENNNFNHKVQITRNVLETNCSNLLSSFFKKLR